MLFLLGEKFKFKFKISFILQLEKFILNEEKVDERKYM